MNNTILKELARTYISDIYYFETIEEFILENEIPEENVKMFKFLVKVETKLNDTTATKNEWIKTLSNCIACQANNDNKNRYFIFHPYTKGSKYDYKYQISLFDNLGAIMDVAAESIIEIIDKIMGCINLKEYKLMEVIPC